MLGGRKQGGVKGYSGKFMPRRRDLYSIRPENPAEFVEEVEDEDWLGELRLFRGGGLHHDEALAVGVERIGGTTSLVAALLVLLVTVGDGQLKHNRLVF